MANHNTKDVTKNIYSVIIFVLCVISVSFAVIDYMRGMTPLQIILDKAIYVLFVIDYSVRFVIADRKSIFVKENIFDLIAIIPVNSAFRIFRMFKFVRLFKFAKITKFFRIGSLSARFLHKTKRFLDTNGFKYVLLLCVSCILAGSVGMMQFEGMKFSDALWWSFVTATTVGYGDLSPSTNAGRIIASILMITGIGLIGSLTSSITSYFLNDKGKSFSSDKVDIAMTVYESLSDDEKEAFKRNIQIK